MRYRAVISIDFTAETLGDLAHHEARVNHAADDLRARYDRVTVHVVECPEPAGCPEHHPLGAGPGGSRVTALSDRPPDRGPSSE